MFKMSGSTIRMIASLVLLFGAAFADDAGISDPLKTDCAANSGIENFTCNMMMTLLNLGPMVAIIALLVGGIIYVYANVFVTADQRGKYHSLATNLALGALILAALVGGAGYIVNAGQGFLVPGSA